MSSIGVDISATPLPRRSENAGVMTCAVIVMLFILGAGLAAQRKDITQGFDEVAHASYVAHLQRTGETWPLLETMRMLDPQTFRFADGPNYLNHPPPFYLLLAKLGPALEGHPGALVVHRLLNILLGAIGLAAALGIGLAARLRRQEFYAYALPLVCIPVLAPLAGAVNNDNLAFMGGAVGTLACWQLVATGRASWLGIALAGMIAAAWAKLTGLMLAGGLVAAICLYLAWRGRLTRRSLILVAMALAIATAPYAIYFAQYGSPVPNTPAQIALFEDGSRAAGWADLPRMRFLRYVGHFVISFIIDWMPTLAPRGPLNYAMLAIPVAALGCTLAGFVISLSRIWRREETALDVVVTAGMLTIAATFVVHVMYSYGHHVTTGWLMEAYPRYYLPLAAILPLAALSLMGTIDHPRLRVALLGFLAAGPLVFRVLGAPLG